MLPNWFNQSLKYALGVAFISAGFIALLFLQLAGSLT